MDRRGRSAHGIPLLMLWRACGLVLLLNTLAGSLHHAYPSEHGPVPPSVQNGPVIRLDKDHQTVAVVGLQPEVLARLQQAAPTQSRWQALFPVHTGDKIPPPPDKPAVLGAYQIEDGVVQFRPRFPFVKGVSYSAQFHFRLLGPPVDQAPLQTAFTLPKLAVTATTVVNHVYPSPDELPENLLKFYVYFSAPMSRGQVYRHIHLVDASGEKIARPFLELEPELWDPETRRLTLLFDPGRIKRGLKPHADLGPPLRAGHSYGLVIDRAIPDAAGAPLAAAYQKTFRATRADRTSPDYKHWRLVAPPAHTRAPVVLHLSESLDHALLTTLFSVYDQKDHPILGQIALANSESQWRFTPQAPWPVGAHQIRIHTALEDLAGNQLNRLFDVALGQTPVPRPDQAPYQTLLFEVRPAP